VDGVGIREWKGFYMVIWNNMTPEEQVHVEEYLHEMNSHFPIEERTKAVEDTIAYMKEKFSTVKRYAKRNGVTYDDVKITEDGWVWCVVDGEEVGLGDDGVDCQVFINK